MDSIIKIMSFILIKGLKQREQIALLDRVGLKPKDIADVLGTSSNTVRVALVALRRAKRGRKGRLKMRIPAES